MAIDFTTLSAEDFAAFAAHMAAQEAAAEAEREAEKAAAKAKAAEEKAARSAARQRMHAFLSKFVRVLAGGVVGPEQTFKSNAQGWSLGGRDIPVFLNPEDPESGVRLARVSILVRWEDTIPASDKD
jgi:hypothetical protein